MTFSACGDPPDETPLGREASAILARPEQEVDHVKVSHVLVAFVGATRGSESGRTESEARTLAEELLKRARAGEDFDALMNQYSNDDGGGTYPLTEDDRHDYAEDFQAVAFRLAVGEIGIANYHPSRSPFGWHVIKRIE
ncbi:MAG TPA: peptidylprolyl isomerase [Planctomycetota bacterium]|nr:peptidylprolyl isomerase [Planctomycetota bacterium]